VPSPPSELWTLLEENHHPFLVVEHNPQLYERAWDMADRVAEAMLPGLSGCILLHAPALDRHLEAMAEFADWVFCFCDMQGELGLRQSKSISEELAGQTSWEAF
jgi:hypothetical protein